MAPLVADALVGLEHGQANTSTGQFVCGGEAGLTPTDYHSLQLLNSTHLVHLSIDALSAVTL